MADKRFKQANREALITLGVYLFFFLWWTVFAFGLGSGDPADYSYVLGFPAWFFYSCILGYPLVTLLLWLVVRRFFKDLPLDEPTPENQLDNLPEKRPGKAPTGAAPAALKAEAGKNGGES